MRENSPETNEHEPTPAEQLSAGIDKIFDKFPENVNRGGRVREFEEQLNLDAPRGFNDAPEATRLIVKRPIPGQEDEAVERWSEFGGPMVEIYENLGAGMIVTIFRVNGQEVLRRRRGYHQGDYNPLYGETKADQLLRRGKERLVDAQGLLALDAVARAQEIKRRNMGEEADPEVVKELIAWLETAEPADLG